MAATGLIGVCCLFKRNISTTASKCITHKPRRKPLVPKYRNKYEEGASNRSDVQRLLNSAKNTIPFDRRFPVTGKNTGPKVEGGSELAQYVAALHVVQMPGYIDRNGRFRGIKEMQPDFVVPDLKDFKLKPYISYRTPEVNQTKLTAKDLFDYCYSQKIRTLYEGALNGDEEMKKQLQNYTNYAGQSSIEEAIKLETGEKKDLA